MAVTCDMTVIVLHITIMSGVISSSLIWSLYFYFCLNLVLIFIKIVQLSPSPN